MTTTAPRWQRRPLERRDELLDAAQRLFVDQGLARTSVADIAAGAGVSKGSLYRYFANKEALLGALKDRFFERMMGRVNVVSASMPTDDLGAVADAAIDATVRLLFEERELVELWCRETPSLTDEFSRGITQLVNAYEQGIRDAAAAGRVDCDDPRTTALMLVYAVEGTATHAILHGDGPSVEELIAAAQVTTRRTLGLPDPPGRR